MIGFSLLIVKSCPLNQCCGTQCCTAVDVPGLRHRALHVWGQDRFMTSFIAWFSTFLKYPVQTDNRFEYQWKSSWNSNKIILILYVKICARAVITFPPFLFIFSNTLSLYSKSVEILKNKVYSTFTLITITNANITLLTRILATVLDTTHLYRPPTL